MSGFLFEVDTVHAWAYAENVFSEEECKKIIEDNKNNFVIGKIKNDEVDLTTRQSQICWVPWSKDVSWIFERLSVVISQSNTNYFNFDLIGIVEDLQLTKYEAPSGYYTKHVDRRFNDITRKLSISVQLSDPKSYEGGDLVIYSPEAAEMKKELGTVIVFPSYMLHEVRPVTKGTRYSLVAWVAGPKFK